MHGYTQNLAVNAQLFVAADAVAVGSQERQLVSAMTHDKARGELGGGGRLARAGRAHQREYATDVEHVGFALHHLQALHQRAAHPGLRLFGVALGQGFQQLARQRRAKTRRQHVAHHPGTGRVTPRQVAPGQIGKLGLQTILHNLDFADHALRQLRAVLTGRCGALDQMTL